MGYPKLIAMVGGAGTRLYSLTLNISKPLMDICNQAVLTRMLDSLVLQGCRKIIIASKGYENTAQLNKYYRSGRAYFSRLGIDVYDQIEYEPNYDDRGSGDALRFCLGYYDIDGDVLVVGGDNLFDIDLDDMLKQHGETGALLTIGLKRTPEDEDISQYGVAVADEDMRLHGFIEKPAKGEEPSRFVNTGIYLFSPEIRKILSAMREEARDIGKHVVPYLVKKDYPVYGYLLSGYWADVGTPGRLLSTNLDILHGKLKNVRLD
ncbi:MAG: nucleotidyltransferase family protein, partial [Candidatus Hydrothermarchaeaceae archaeon]